MAEPLLDDPVLAGVVGDRHAPAAGHERAVELAQRGIHVRDVLEHLDAERRVERRVADGERRHLSLEERDVREPFAAMTGRSEHLPTPVDSDHGAVTAHVVEQLGRVEARPAAGIQDGASFVGTTGADNVDVDGETAPFGA